MRVKILEGLATGKIIITTSIGAEGINYIDGKNLFIADTPKEFMEVIKKLSVEPELIKSVSSEAQKLAYLEYDNKIISERLVSFYRSLFR